MLESDAIERSPIGKGECVERAVNYANALRDVFSEYEYSLELYELVLKAGTKFTPAVCDRAILLRRWSRGAHPKVATEMRGGQAMREACEQLQQNLDRTNGFFNLLVLADLHIEERDWERVRKVLDRAERQCGEMRLRHLEILVRRGILLLATEKPEEAARLFRQALVYRPGELVVKAYLGQALLNSKRYEAALRAFREVLDVAPGHVEALVGSAQTSIELADGGDVDHYVLAERFLTDSLRFGRDRGSVKLRDVDVADVYYMRGYARIKRYESDMGVFRSIVLMSAFNDFRQAGKNDPEHGPASLALNKVAQQIRRRSSESIGDIVGPIVVSVAAGIVFALAQIDFFLRGTRLHQMLAMPAESVLQQPGYYATVTFSALAVMIAGVSLRKLLKLKIAGIELERTAPARLVPAVTLGIGRFNQFDNFLASTLRGLGATPGDVSKPATNPESQGKGKGKEASAPQPVNPTPGKLLLPAA
jgi:tetratricopeptide (TPR) repeat protein